MNKKYLRYEVYQGVVAVVVVVVCVCRVGGGGGTCRATTISAQMTRLAEGDVRHQWRVCDDAFALYRLQDRPPSIAVRNVHQHAVGRRCL